MLKLGADAEVMAPAELREALRLQAAQLLALYAD